MTRFIVILWLTFCCALAQAKEVIPPAPKNHFNDYAGVISSAAAAQLNNELAQFERDSGNQFVVAIYPKMQSDSSVDDYAVRVFRSWGVGTKEKNNGIVLFIFIQDHKLFIQTGYGLEGALPDALCKRIVEDEIVPQFKQGDFNGGVTAGVHAVIAATKGEYKGSGRTVAEQRRGNGEQSIWPFVLMALFIGVPILIAFSTMRRGYSINSGGYSGGFWTGGGGGGGWSSGGGGFDGGGSFSGGGGSTGGGGAGGSW